MYILYLQHIRFSATRCELEVLKAVLNLEHLAGDIVTLEVETACRVLTCCDKIYNLHIVEHAPFTAFMRICILTLSISSYALFCILL